MKANLDHAALNVQEFEWYISFFEDVFGMKEEKRQGEMPYRKIWLDGGIQLCECQVTTSSAGPMDHLGFEADDVDAIVAAAKERGCVQVPFKPTWFILPNGVVIELKPSAAKV